MPELLTPRLRCSPLQLDDWSFFLSLQQDPQVMLYVADPRPQAAIREAFDSRLPPWTPTFPRGFSPGRPPTSAPWWWAPGPQASLRPLPLLRRASHPS